jgi:tetratricopeptide (TPR) repeat protein
MKNMLSLIAIPALAALAACAGPPDADPAGKGEPEAYALSGATLYAPPLSPAAQARNDSLLAIARADYEADPSDLDNIIWLGRRTAYLGRYREAIDIFTLGIQRHPNSPELYRHRGHRFISTRALDRALGDFARAAELARDRPLEIEPDGLPNALGVPLGNLHFNIYYHWALAHYLKGDFEEAARLYEQCMNYSVNDDLRCATADWLYMSYRRLGEEEKAAQVLEGISPDMEIVENHAYHHRLLLYKGLVAPEELLRLDLASTDPDQSLQLVTQGYGVGNWHLYQQRDTAQARRIFEQIVAAGNWPAFGHIAAEADLQRLKN